MDNTKELLKFGVTSSEAPAPKTDEAGKILKDYVAITNTLRKQRNNLLGKFNEAGKYTIDDEAILSQLLILPKKFDRKEDGAVYACTKFQSFVLNFKIVFELEPSFCKAHLYLIEIDHSVEEDVKLTTLLQSKEEVYSPRFKEEIYDLWRVYLDEQIYEKTDYIETYLNYQSENYSFNEELIEILSQLYLIRMLKALENCGELGEKIKAEYKLMVERLLAQDPSLSQNYIKLKLILDGLIEKHGAMPTIMKTQEGVAVVAGYINPMKRVLSPASVVKELGSGVEEKAKEQEQKKSPAPAKAKPKGKVKGGGGKSKPAKAFDVAKVFESKKKPAKKSEDKKLFVPPAQTAFKTADKTAEKQVQSSPAKESTYEDMIKIVNDIAGQNKTLSLNEEILRGGGKQNIHTGASKDDIFKDGEKTL